MNIIKNFLKNKYIILFGKIYPYFEKLLNDDTSSADNFLSKTLFKLLSFAAITILILLPIDFILTILTDKGGVFGDFFGGVLNPILTFLTFFGLIVTIVIQRQELKLARVEFEKTANALNIQAIETTFFNILDLHHKIVDNSKIDLKEIEEKNALKSMTNLAQGLIASNLKISNEKVFYGRNTFEAILNFITHDTSSPKEVLKRYQTIQNEYNHILGHYFKNLYQALKVIDNYSEDTLSNNEKHKYSIINKRISNIIFKLLRWCIR